MLPSLHFLTGNTGQSVRWQGRAMPAGTSGRPVQAMLKPSLDGYRIGRIIGEGRAATVYLADDLRRGGNVALKFLKGSCGESEAIRQGFAAECAILSAIQHEHVVRAHRAPHRQRSLLPDDGIPGRRQPARAHAPRYRPRAGFRAAAPGRGRTGAGASASGRSSRSQAGEFPDALARRDGAHRFRRGGRPRRQCGTGRARPAGGHGRLHRARAVPGRAARQRRGRLQPGHRVLRDVARTAAVCRRPPCWKPCRSTWWRRCRACPERSPRTSR